MAVNSKDNLSAEELEWQRRREARVQRMRREKEKQLKRQRIFKLAMPIAAVALSVCIVGIVLAVTAKEPEAGNDEKIVAEESSVSGNGLLGQAMSEEESRNDNLNPSETLETESLSQTESGGEEVDSENVGTELTPEEAIAMQSTISGVQTVTTAPKAPTIATAGGQYEAHTTDATAAPPEEVDSTNVVFIDLESGEVLAQRGYKEMVSPASMTKVLTILVAAEYVTDLDDTFTMTIDITDYSFSNDCSNVGFEVGEVVTVRDLFYGTVLPSGGDAAVGLATYVAGSHEAFVDMMNEKLEELGLSDTAHFTNCVGLYDENHYCTVYDMAMIMEAALQNDLCREILRARTYTTSATKEHPEGITISNWFIRRIEDKDTGGEILGAKTGYVNESGSCAVSYGVDKSGKGYVCATTGAYSSWRCIYDHVALYKKYAQE